MNHLDLERDSVGELQPFGRHRDCEMDIILLNVLPVYFHTTVF
jgi:hypothetical protein